ncbi:MAG: DNA repair protein RecN [Pseudomonadota bacterium]
MLRGLAISNLLIIDHLELNFERGLNVLTGETGAGKSILLDALGFVLGWRGRADLVRQGADRGEVTAWFDLDDAHPAHAVLEAAGLPLSDELILRRINIADGRKTAWVNDTRCSGDVLRRLSDTLVELHGQQDDRGLLNPRGHRDILDDFGTPQDLRRRVRDTWAAKAAAAQRVAEAEARVARIRDEEDYLRHAAQELGGLQPEPGEEAVLDAQRRLMQGAEKIRADVMRAHDALGHQGAEAAMSEALRWLDGAASHVDGALDQPMAALERTLAGLDEVLGGLSDIIERLSFNPTELEDVEERLFAIRGLARKHDVQPDDLAAFAAALRDKIAALDAGAADLANLGKDLRAAQSAYEAAAQELSKARRAAAVRLDKAVGSELLPLKMERAIFHTTISDATAGPDGIDAVAFTVATNPGAPAGPLNKIASGGELSRFLLALKVCLTKAQSGVTMIFDEIDRGVGGATADAVGRRLADLGDGGQVLVVTHSPQVAALGAHHWRVEKRVHDGMTTSTVVQLPQSERVDEIARMLSGDTITDEARGAARALLTG